MSVTDLERIEAKLDAVLKALHERGWDSSPSGQHALSLEATTKALGVSLTTVRKLLREGQLRSVMIAGRRVVPRSEIDRLLTPVEPKARPLRKKQPADWREEARLAREQLGKKR